MRLLECPLHVSLLDTCITEILEQHGDLLPDLSSLVILTPTSDGTTKYAIRHALTQRVHDLGYTSYILPKITTLRSWAHLECTPDLVINELSEVLDLVLTLKDQKSEPFARLNEANPWAVAREMLWLFEDLWLNDIALPSDQQAFTQQLQKSYGLSTQGETAAPFHLETEAGIVHLLWCAWDQSSDDIVSPGKSYREALHGLPDNPPKTLSALYLCGHEYLRKAEVLALEQVSKHFPVTLLTRTRHLIPYSGEPLHSSDDMSPRTEFITQAFAGPGPSIRDRALACAQIPQSPISGSIRLLAAEESEPHAVAIELQIRKWLQAGNQRIGLVTEDRRLARRVHALLARSNIKMTDAFGWALSTTGAASLIHNWIECVEQDFHYLLLLNVLKSPFVALPTAGNTRGEHGRALVTRLEQHLCKKNVFQSLAQYREALTRKPDETEPELEQLLDWVQQAARPVQTNEAVTAEKYFGGFLESLKRLGSQELLKGDEVGAHILRVLEKIRFELQKRPETLPVRHWRTILRARLEQATHEFYTHDSKVTLVNLDQTHLVEFDYLIVAGMDSRHYPGGSTGSTVFNDTVRANLGLRQKADVQKLRLQRFISSLISAREALLIYQKRDQEQDYHPSVWWSQLDTFYRLIYGKTSSLHDDSLAHLSLTASLMQFDENFSPPQPPPSGPSAPELLPSKLSASGHQTLIDCPYQFFISQMLGLREPMEIHETMDHKDLGSFAHTCLEIFNDGDESVPGTPWDGPISDRRQEAEDLLYNIGKHVLKQFHAAGHAKSGYLAHWKRIRKRYLDLQASLRDRHIEENETQQSVSIDEQLELHGRLDRVDCEGDGNLVVVDYKTGTASISPGQIQSGEKVQLSTYALLLPKANKVEYWWLGESDEKRRQSGSKSDGDLQQAKAQVRRRLIKLYADLREGEAMPANGDTKTCSYCYAKGICRKDI